MPRKPKTFRPSLTHEEIARRYKLGSTITEIAEAASVDTPSVLRSLRASGLRLQSVEEKIAVLLAQSALTANELRKRYANGESVRAVAAAAGINHNSMRKLLAALGVKVRKAGSPPGAKYERVLTLAQREALAAEIRAGEGRSLAAIGRKYGISRVMARNYAVSIGVDTYTLAARRKRKAAARGVLRAERNAARAAKINLLSALWIARASPEEIFEKTGYRGTANVISRIRKAYPDLFPYRDPLYRPRVRS